MTAAGFKDYAEFIKAVYTEVQKHADGDGWLPVYYNLCDEPLGADLTNATANADGVLQFEDTEAASHAVRCYRALGFTIHSELTQWTADASGPTVGDTGAATAAAPDSGPE